MENKDISIDFRQLETFCRVAHVRSFSKAAEDLFLTQPTVSGHILSLEKSLALRLFDRTGREVGLTKAGELFLRYASRILATRRDLMNALSEFSQGIKGELSLGASTIPGEYLLPKLLAGFRREYPHFRISLKVSDTKEIVGDVLEGNIELGMTGAKLNHSALHYERYAEDEITVVAHPDHPLAKKKNVGLEVLLKEPWIIREEGSGTQMAVEKSLRKRGRSLKQFSVVMEMGSTSSVKEGVKAGVGLAFLSRRAAEEELHQGTLASIGIEGVEPMARQIYVVSHRRRALSPVGTQFLRFLKRNRARINEDGSSETA